jgi:nucleoside-diphosphate-sugar epimerase
MRVLVTGHRGYIGAHLVGLLKAGMEELLSRYRAHGFSARDFDGDQFVRLRTLRHRLDRVMGEPRRKTA